MNKHSSWLPAKIICRCRIKIITSNCIICQMYNSSRTEQNQSHDHHFHSLQWQLHHREQHYQQAQQQLDLLQWWQQHDLLRLQEILFPLLLPCIPHDLASCHLLCLHNPSSNVPLTRALHQVVTGSHHPILIEVLHTIFERFVVSNITQLG